MSFLLDNCFVSAVGTALYSVGLSHQHNLEALGRSWSTDEELKASKSSLLQSKVAEASGNVHRTVGENWAREKPTEILCLTWNFILCCFCFVFLN